MRRAMVWSSPTALLLLGLHGHDGADHLIEVSVEAEPEAGQLQIQLLQELSCGMTPAACKLNTHASQ